MHGSSKKIAVRNRSPMRSAERRAGSPSRKKWEELKSVRKKTEETEAAP